MGLLSLLGVTLATHAVVSQTALRSGCEADDPVVAQLAAGDQVEIKFALSGSSGSCYKVEAVSGGRQWQGYLPARAIKDVSRFDRERAGAPGLDSSTSAVAGEDHAGKGVGLLNGNQPAEALRQLEAALRANRKDASLLAAAGYAAMQSDQVKLAADYFEESLALSPDPRVAALLERARKELAHDSSGAALVGARFQLRYNPAEVKPADARSLVPLLDSEFARISMQLGCPAMERIPTAILSPADYRASTGAAEWSGGRYDGRIKVALLEPKPGEATRRALSHEIVHACLAFTGQWPVWLHEGLAQKLSGETIDESGRQLVKSLTRQNKIPPLAALSGSWTSMGSNSADLAYKTALVAADYLYAAYGMEGVRSLLQSPERLPQIAADLDHRIRQ